MGVYHNSPRAHARAHARTPFQALPVPVPLVLLRPLPLYHVIL